MNPSGACENRKAFSLVELMVVISIIGFLSLLALPSMKGIGRSARIQAAERQLLDDLGLGRQLAMSQRSDVYFVFLDHRSFDPDLVDPELNSNSEQRLRIQELWEGVYSGYALYSRRQVGSQPGRPVSAYLSDWKFLPEGIFFRPLKGVHDHQLVGGLIVPGIPFPNGDSQSRTIAPALLFNSQGSLYQFPYGTNTIDLMEGSISHLFNRDQHGRITSFPPLFTQQAERNLTLVSQLEIDYQSGRARVLDPLK